MTADDRLALIRTKIERAKHHIRDLDRVERAFYDSNPYRIGREIDPKTRKVIYYLAEIPETPVEIPQIIGDALQNLRSSLDHLAYQLCAVGGGTPAQLASVQFPIGDSIEKYEAGKGGKVQGMRREAIEAIDAIQPYRGGNTPLWILHRLNNIDKHRKILLAGTRNRGVDIGVRAWAYARRKDPSLPEFPGPLPEILMREVGDGLPLKRGHVLWTDPPDSEPTKDLYFTLEIAFYEPGVVQDEPTVPTLLQLAEFVDNVVTRFKPLLG